MQRSNSESSSPALGGRTPEMSLYDKHRRPHKLITDATEIVISPRSLDSELMCPICLDMLNTTMTTKECLHRFCQECITTGTPSFPSLPSLPPSLPSLTFVPLQPCGMGTRSARPVARSSSPSGV